MIFTAEQKHIVARSIRREVGAYVLADVLVQSIVDRIEQELAALERRA